MGLHNNVAFVRCFVISLNEVYFDDNTEWGWDESKQNMAHLLACLVSPTTSTMSDLDAETQKAFAVASFYVEI